MRTAVIHRHQSLEKEPEQLPETGHIPQQRVGMKPLSYLKTVCHQLRKAESPQVLSRMPDLSIFWSMHYPSGYV